MRKSLQTLGLSVFIVLVLITIFLGFLWGIDNPISWIGIVVLIAIPFVHKWYAARHFITWTDDLSVGIEIIDEDHKKLVNLINELQRAVDYHMGESYERKAMKELADYTKYHFEREEDLMESNGYPGFEEHKKEHEAMIAKVKACCGDYKKKKHGAIDEMAAYLRSWLINHIKGTDQRYVPYLHEKGVR